MKVYYFSGTGNTLYLGKKIQEQTGCELINISTILHKETVLEGDIGFLFPIYAMGIPRIVETFLENCKVKNLKYLFAIGTCGGSGYGIPFKQINKILKRKQTSLDYYEYCHMPDNYIKLFTPMSEEKAKEDILESENRINGIIKNIKKQEILRLKESKLLYFAFLLIYKFWRYGLKRNSKDFIVTEKCISCGFCKEICPVNNIFMSENKPHWNKNCEECLACVHLCPTKAILYGEKSKSGIRYKNPFIDIIELKK
ncbi:EFR1 family ferrodoxin [uncultured Cetobacterium sp.]|uniref:EFR1 family ferrodoxin n=1 Tax=uncultured Cetobacterium sp. TaxID=527638 RepID=UPI0026044515|nr:EFR1 family ferrodoxin [uncultured Cetobacterium sp.]